MSPRFDGGRLAKLTAKDKRMLKHGRFVPVMNAVAKRAEKASGNHKGHRR
jgi:hypothetical protein